MRKTAAWLARYALEQIGIRYTFGIPGVHNTELYDELNSSDKIQPILVTHEVGAAFMADAISRTTDSVGTLVVVPAAGITHAASGIAEAFVDGIPMLIITGGVRTDTGRAYQLHDMDQQALLQPITKARFHPKTHSQVIPAFFEAYRVATSGEAGPVFIELPVNLQLFPGEVEELPELPQQVRPPPPATDKIKVAADLLVNANHPGIFLGWGAYNARRWSIKLAEVLSAPVSTTLQGLSCFPADHPLHTGMGFNRSAVPAAEHAFARCDALLAVGTRFAEIPTGSFGAEPPENLIHVDINPRVFNANYPAKLALEGDAEAALHALYQAVVARQSQETSRENLAQTISRDKKQYRDQWLKHDSHDRVNPQVFFHALDEALDNRAIIVADDGNHTYLTAELMPMSGDRQFLSPTDFNCMGYGVPAAIGAKLGNPDRTVVGIVGDGAFLMTGMETLTARANHLGCVCFIFNDGELSQIAQAQAISYNRKTCTLLPAIDFGSIANATGCEFFTIKQNAQVKQVVFQALSRAAENKPVLVDVNVDYSKRTRFTEGTVKTNLNRFSVGNKARFIGRALLRKLTG